MIPLIEDNRDALRALCRTFSVARLEVYGSAVDGTFDEARSDVDFLVEFAPDQDLGPWLAYCQDFKSAVEGLLGRKVDLVMPKAVRNRHFQQEMNRTRRLLYAA